MESVSSRLPEDVAARVEQYAEERNISQSEAVRRLLIAGLEREQLEDEIVDLRRRVQRLERPFWERLFR